MASKASTGVRSTTTVYNPSPVSPVHFAEAMRAHWATLGNASSEKLIVIVSLQNPLASDHTHTEKSIRP